MTRKLRILAAVLALMILAGCGHPDGESAATNTPTQTPTSAPTAPTAPTTPTVPTDPQQPDPPEPSAPLPELESLTILTCVEFDSFPEMLSLGDGLVVASRNTYSELQGRINETLIIDILNDEVIASSVRAHSMELVAQKFQDGAILQGEPDTGKFYVFDENLNFKSAFAAPNLDGYFAYDRSAYYYLQENVLYSMNLSTLQSAPVQLQQTLRFESLVGIHPQEDWLVARVYLDSDSTDYGVAVVDAKSGQLLLLRSDLTHVWLTEDRFVAVEMSTTCMGFDVYYGSMEGGDILRIDALQLYSSSVSYSALPSADYLFWRYDPDEGEKATKIYDLTQGAVVAELSQLEFSAAVFNPIYLAHEKGILGYYSIKEPKTPENPYPKEKLQLALINPDKLTYTQGPVPEAASWQTWVDPEAVQY